MPREKSPNYYDAHTLVACIEFTNALEMQNRVQEWPTLSKILNPDPRATSTYAAINKWLQDPRVDVLSQVHTERDDTHVNRDVDADAKLQREVAFLYKDSNVENKLPDANSQWWCGGRKEIHDEDNIDMGELLRQVEAVHEPSEHFMNRIGITQAFKHDEATGNLQPVRMRTKNQRTMQSRSKQ